MSVTGRADHSPAPAGQDQEPHLDELEVDRRRLELRLGGLRRQLDARLAQVRELSAQVGGLTERVDELGHVLAEAEQAADEWRRRAVAAEIEVAAINGRFTMRVTRRPRQLYGWLRAQRARHARR